MLVELYVKWDVDYEVNIIVYNVMNVFKSQILGTVSIHGQMASVNQEATELYVYVSVEFTWLLCVIKPIQSAVLISVKLIS